LLSHFITSPTTSPSHYTTTHRTRDGVCAKLWQAGIDTAFFWVCFALVFLILCVVQFFRFVCVCVCV